MGSEDRWQILRWRSTPLAPLLKMLAGFCSVRSTCWDRYCLSSAIAATMATTPASDLRVAWPANNRRGNAAPEGATEFLFICCPNCDLSGSRSSSTMHDADHCPQTTRSQCTNDSCAMTGKGHKRSFRDPIGMSAPGGRADVFRQNADIRISMLDCRGRPTGCAGGCRPSGAIPLADGH